VLPHSDQGGSVICIKIVPLFVNPRAKLSVRRKSTPHLCHSDGHLERTGGPFLGTMSAFFPTPTCTLVAITNTPRSLAALGLQGSGSLGDSLRHPTSVS
jgi:hypothetical protein